MVKIVFKARLGDGPIQVVGEYEPSPEEWPDELEDFEGSEQDWLANRGADWAYEAVRTDCLHEWAEIERDSERD